MRNGIIGSPGTIAVTHMAPPASCSVRLCRVNWCDEVGAEIALGRGAGHDQTGRQRDQQRRDLRDEPVTDGQQAVGLDRLAERHVLLEHADREAADQVDRDDDDGGDRVALHELRRTVHRAVEVGFFGDLTGGGAWLRLR